MNLAPGRFQVIELPPPPPLNPNARKIVAHISQSIWLAPPPPFDSSGRHVGTHSYAWMRRPTQGTLALPASPSSPVRTQVHAVWAASLTVIGRHYPLLARQGHGADDRVSAVVAAVAAAAAAAAAVAVVNEVPFFPPTSLFTYFRVPISRSPPLQFFIALLFSCFALCFFPFLVRLSSLPPRSQSGVNGFLLLQGLFVAQRPSASLPVFVSPLYIPLF